MKKLVVIILMFSLVLQGFMSLGLTGMYWLNKKYIADKLCINKSKPAMHCHGKCYLKKQLAKSSEEENEQSKTSTIRIIDCSMPEVFYSIAITRFPIQLKEYSLSCNDNTLEGVATNVFRPPLS